MTVRNLPPEEIYDVLHEAEAAEIKLPKSVEDWWKQETRLQQDEQDKRRKAEG